MESLTEIGNRMRQAHNQLVRAKQNYENYKRTLSPLELYLVEKKEDEDAIESDRDYITKRYKKLAGSFRHSLLNDYERQKIINDYITNRHYKRIQRRNKDRGRQKKEETIARLRIRRSKPIKLINGKVTFKRKANYVQ